MSIEIHVGADDAMQLMLALDTGMTALSIDALAHGLSRGEIDHAMIQFRTFRALLMQKRADALSAIIKRKTQP